MKTVALTSWNADWTTLTHELERTGEPIALVINETIYGILLPAHEAQPMIERYANRTGAQQAQVTDQPGAVSGRVRTYLELLHDDPSLVPLADGQPLEFVTMMNSSYVDPAQLYEFRDPRSGQSVIYRADELRQAIGRSFVPVGFIPPRPRDVVEGKLELR